MTSNAIEACKFLKEDIIKIEKKKIFYRMCTGGSIARLYMQTANDRLTIASTISQKKSSNIFFVFFLLFISLTLFLVFSTASGFR